MFYSKVRLEIGEKSGNCLNEWTRDDDIIHINENINGEVISTANNREVSDLEVWKPRAIKQEISCENQARGACFKP